jgi:trk system potassium uptake protein
MVEEHHSSTVDRLILRVPRIRAARLALIVPKANNPLSSTLILVYGFAGLIILGMILLILPVSSSSGNVTSPINAFFTAASSVCLCGLVVVDTGTYWSIFGQAVLLVLFQIGGFGFIVGATLLILAIGGRFGLREKLFIADSLGMDRIGGILGIVVKVAIFSLMVEAAGAAIFYFRWLAAGEPGSSAWTAVFHSVSAFNNCGMDLFGSYKSLVDYQSDPTILLVTALLILLGSTGYVVIADIGRKRSFFRLSLDSKIVLVTTLVLLVIGTLFYLIAEHAGAATLGPLSWPQKVMVAFFQSVTPRTAGFTAVDIGQLKSITLFFTMFLMFIGGAAGSTAGGVKVNTLGVIFITVISAFRGREHAEAFGRQLTRQTVYRAISLLIFFLGIICLFVILLSITEAFPMDSLLFETLSALGTVGLSTGITPALSAAGKIIIVFAMFVGRLAPLTFMAFLVRRQQATDIEYPPESIRLG